MLKLTNGCTSCAVATYLLLLVLATSSAQAVAASSPNSAAADVGDMRREVEKDIPRLFSISGLVVDTAPDVSEESLVRLERAKSGEEFRAAMSKMFDSRPVPNAKVVLEGKQGRLETTTDAKGQFQFKSVPGRRSQYLCVEIAPKGGDGRQVASTRKLWNPEYSSAIVLEPRADLITIRGRVLDASGQPIAGVKVTGQDAYYLEVGPLPEIQETLTGSDGSYELRGFKPADLYTIGAYLAGGGSEPNSTGAHFSALIEVKADGFQKARITVPLVSEQQVAPGRRFLNALIQISKAEGQAWREPPKEPVLRPSQGNVITGVDIVLKRP